MYLIMMYIQTLKKRVTAPERLKNKKSRSHLHGILVIL
uniref:Uncharacterized protein n=1 Tax=Myoviridae sp. ctsip2 TaxID=2826705 RepID=A0A8S5N5A5_9CAUD|nr:MAG TPA: hypothetical protein [Myoviridae sp. ctsip2]